MTEFTRLVEWSPAYDKRNPDPHKDYGIHGVDVRFVLKGELGAVQFLLYTNWMLPEVRNRLERRGDHLMCEPLPADLGYHSPRPLYDGQTPIIDEPCPYIGGLPCYYDGSGLNAKAVYERLLREGDAGVWAALEEAYREWFAADQAAADAPGADA